MVAVSAFSVLFWVSAASSSGFAVAAVGQAYSCLCLLHVLLLCAAFQCGVSESLCGVSLYQCPCTEFPPHVPAPVFSGTCRTEVLLMLRERNFEVILGAGGGMVLIANTGWSLDHGCGSM